MSEGGVEIDHTSIRREGGREGGKKGRIWEMYASNREY